MRRVANALFIAIVVLALTAACATLRTTVCSIAKDGCGGLCGVGCTLTGPAAGICTTLCNDTVCALIDSRCAVAAASAAATPDAGVPAIPAASTPSATPDGGTAMTAAQHAQPAHVIAVIRGLLSRMRIVLPAPDGGAPTVTP